MSTALLPLAARAAGAESAAPAAATPAVTPNAGQVTPGTPNVKDRTWQAGCA
jgi:hypothetical protein